MILLNSNILIESVFHYRGISTRSTDIVEFLFHLFSVSLLDLFIPRTHQVVLFLLQIHTLNIMIYLNYDREIKYSYWNNVLTARADNTIASKFVIYYFVLHIIPSVAQQIYLFLFISL